MAPRKVRVNRFSPEAQKMQFRENLVQENLPKVPLKHSVKNVVYHSDAFDTLAKDDKALRFKEAKTQSGESILEILGKKSDEATDKVRTEIRTALNDVFNSSTGFEAAKEAYKTSRIDLQAHLEKHRDTHPVAAIWAAMKTDGDTARAALIAQQKKETDALQAKLEDPDFILKLKTALETTDDTAIELAKKSLTDQLEASHKKQLADFDKALEDSCKSVLNADTNAKKRFLFIADLYRNDAAMRKLIEEQAIKNQGLKDEGKTTVSFDKNGPEISSVSLDQLKYIKEKAFLKGGEIKQTEPGVFSLKMNARWYSSYYYASGQDKADLLTMAQAVKASGSEYITMKLTFSNKDIAAQRGRDAYEAAIKAGFPPEKIRIIVNGKLYTNTAQEKSDKNPEKSESIAEGLFGTKNAVYQKLQADAQKYKKEFADSIKDLNKKPNMSEEEIKAHSAEIKRIISQFKADEAAKAKKAPPAGGDNNAPPRGNNNPPPRGSNNPPPPPPPPGGGNNAPPRGSNNPPPRGSNNPPPPPPPGGGNNAPPRGSNNPPPPPGGGNNAPPLDAPLKHQKINHMERLGLNNDYFGTVRTEKEINNELQKLYNKLVLKHHPDKGGDIEIFKEIVKAYKILTNSAERNAYLRQEQLPGAVPVTAGEIRAQKIEQIKQEHEIAKQEFLDNIEVMKSTYMAMKENKNTPTNDLTKMEADLESAWNQFAALVEKQHEEMEKMEDENNPEMDIPPDDNKDEDENDNDNSPRF